MACCHDVRPAAPAPPFASAAAAEDADSFLGAGVHLGLCAGQCAVWHSREQYHTSRQREHRDSLRPPTSLQSNTNPART